MTINKNSISNLFKPSINFFSKHYLIIFIVFVVGIFSFLIFNIGYYSVREPSQQEIDDQLNKTLKLTIDKQSIEKIKQLKDQNINIEPDFPDSRNNPFNE